MPVRVRPSALIAPLACDGRHATLRRSKTRFDSWQGHWPPSPRVCRTHGGLRSRKAGFDSRVGGSRAVLFRSLSSECDGRAHDLAKVGDQVRFLARTWPCDGLSSAQGAGARRPGGGLQNRRSGFDSRRRLSASAPSFPSRGSPAQTEVEHVAVGVGRRELLAPIRRLIRPCPMRVGPTTPNHRARDWARWSIRPKLRKASFSRMAITTCGRESISTAIAWLPCCGPTPGNVN